MYKSGSDKDCVWGAVYSIILEKLDTLANQEAAYQQIPIEVQLESGAKMSCFTFIHKDQLADPPLLPNEDSKPSWQYLSVLYHGSKTIKLPLEYQDFLRKHPAKEATGPVPIFNDLVVLSNNKLTLLQPVK